MFKIVNGGKLPTRGSRHSACVDVYANEDIEIGAGETKVVGLGIAIDLERLNDALINGGGFADTAAQWDNFLSSHFLQLMLRSSLGKSGLVLSNGVGVIDLDYPDEIKMIIAHPISGMSLVENDVDAIAKAELDGKSYKIAKGDRIGQVTMLEHKSFLFGINTEESRTGGIGSTGKR